MRITNQVPAVIPSLHEWTQQAGSFTITHESRLLINQGFAQNLKVAAAFLQQEVQRDRGLSITSEIVTDSEPGSVFLTLAVEDTPYVTPGLDLLPNDEYLYSLWILDTHPNSLGYKICVWADEAEGQPDEFFEKYLFQPRVILAERSWNSANPARSLPAFLESVEELLIDE